MKPQRLSQYRGKIVVLNFWATWCEPCKAELPMLVEEQEHYRDRGVIVIGASLDDATTVKKVRPFAKKEKLNFRVWIGATVDHLEKLGLGQAVPATAFFDREGNLVGRVMGELRQPELEHRIVLRTTKREILRCVPRLLSPQVRINMSSPEAAPCTLRPSNPQHGAHGASP